MDKDGVFLTTAVLPLAIKYTVVARWRSPFGKADRLYLYLHVQKLCVEKELESSFHHCGIPVRLVQACLCMGKTRESRFHRQGGAVKNVQAC